MYANILNIKKDYIFNEGHLYSAFVITNVYKYPNIYDVYVLHRIYKNQIIRRVGHNNMFHCVYLPHLHWHLTKNICSVLHTAL